MQTITKFKTEGVFYHAQTKNSTNFYILKREGKKLKVKSSRNLDECFYVTIDLAADEDGAYEYFLSDYGRIRAVDWLPIGRSMSELPPERQKIIMAAVMRDVERRKHQAPATAHDTINEYDIVDNEIDK